MPTKQQEIGLYKRGKIYWLFYTRRGKKNSISTKTTSKSEAIKFKYEFLENLDKQNNIDNNITVNSMIPINGEFINNIVIKNNTNIDKQQQAKHLFEYEAFKFLEEKKISIKETTAKNYEIIIKHFLLFFEKEKNTKNLLIESITKTQIEDYEKYRIVNNNCSSGEMLKELAIIGSIFKYAVDNSFLYYNLFDNYRYRKKYKNYEPRERFLTPNECIRIIENSNEYLKRLIIFLLETGLRIKEALNLQYTDIAYDKQNNINFVRIRKEISKNKKERFIPLSMEAMKQINKQHAEFNSCLYIFTDSKGNAYKTYPKRVLKTALTKAQIKDTKNVGFHIFRHTFASQKLQGINYKGESIKPVRIEIISQILGHSSIDITSKVYAKLDKSSLVEMIM